MKKKSLLYIFYSVGVIVGLITFMFVYSSTKNQSFQQKDIDNKTAVSESKNSEEIYSADGIELVLNYDEPIEIGVNCSIKFDEGFISTYPYSYAKKIKYFYNGIELIDRSIKFDTLGVNNIDLVLGSGIIKSFEVIVIEENSLPFVQNKSTMRLNESKTIAQMFTTTTIDYEVAATGSLNYDDGFLVPISLGEGKVSLTLNKGKYKITYDYAITVTDEANLDLIIENMPTEAYLDLNNSSKLRIQYSISPEEDGENEQVMVNIQNASLADDKIKINPPIVEIDFLQLLDREDVTFVLITLSLMSDERVNQTIKVNFVR